MLDMSCNPVMTRHDRPGNRNC